MKKIFYLFLAFLPGIAWGGQGKSNVTIYNPFGGHLQYLGPGQGLQPGENYYLYQNSSTDAYWTFDGTNLCLFVNDVSKVCYVQAPAGHFLLLEDGTNFLLEDGTKMLLEQ